VIGGDGQQHVVLAAGLGQPAQRRIQARYHLLVAIRSQVLPGAVYRSHINQHEKFLAGQVQAMSAAASSAQALYPM